VTTPKVRCADCKRTHSYEDIVIISRVGGGTYRRPPRTYHPRICVECAMDTYLYGQKNSATSYAGLHRVLTEWAERKGMNLSNQNVRESYLKYVYNSNTEKPGEFSDDPETGAKMVGWNSMADQQKNFATIVEAVEQHGAPLQGLTLHDAGCGNGALLTYLKSVNKEPRGYIGTDLLPLYVAAAGKAHPGSRFEMRDLMVQQVPKADITVTIGALAFHKPRAVEALLPRLWEATGCVLAFTTWWNLDKTYVYHEHIDQLRRCILRFVKGKNHTFIDGPKYGQAQDAIFVVTR